VVFGESEPPAPLIGVEDGGDQGRKKPNTNTADLAEAKAAA